LHFSQTGRSSKAIVPSEVQMMIEVYRSSVIPAPAKRVWALVRDFNSMPEWNMTVSASAIEDGPADRIGCRRVLSFDDGSIWIHELTDLSDKTMSISYKIVGTPEELKVPISNYHATIRLIDITDGGLCAIEWRAQFESDDEAGTRGRAGAVFQAGFDGLKRKFASRLPAAQSGT
jgi:hypothetical protein